MTDVQPADLAWWLVLASRVEWKWASTYAQKAPHDYVVRGKTHGMADEDFRRAARVIHTFGEPGRYHRSTNIYLQWGSHRWWTMDKNLDETSLINRAVNDRVYGVQDAPRTYNAAWTEYDQIGAMYDTTVLRDAARDAALIAAIREKFGTHAPKTLDIGCGTGALLDLAGTTPKQYTGIDPSQAMLNSLVRKHPRVRRLIPARVEDVPAELLANHYDLVVALDVPALSSKTLERIDSIPAHLTLIT